MNLKNPRKRIKSHMDGLGTPVDHPNHMEPVVELFALARGPIFFSSVNGIFCGGFILQELL